jgi:hypothetical protein
MIQTSKLPIGFVLLASLAFSGGCGKAPSAPTPAAPAAKTSWSIDEMAEDPEGYLRWARERLFEQRKLREERLKSVSEKRAEVEARRAKFALNVDDCDNIVARFRTSIRRADDEDRWPFVVNGRSFDRAKAEAVVAECVRRTEERRPFLAVYDEALAKLGDVASQLKSDLAALERTREKLELDYERVRLSKGVAELADLKKTEAEIAHYAELLKQVVEEATPGSPGGKPEPPPIDVDKLFQ